MWICTTWSADIIYIRQSWGLQYNTTQGNFNLVGRSLSVFSVEFLFPCKLDSFIYNFVPEARFSISKSHVYASFVVAHLVGRESLPLYSEAKSKNPDWRIKPILA